MPSKKYDEFLTDFQIGQIALVIQWLKKYNIPFKEEKIKRFNDKNGSTTSFRVLHNKDTMLEDFDILANPENCQVIILERAENGKYILKSELKTHKVKHNYQRPLNI